MYATYTSGIIVGNGITEEIEHDGKKLQFASNITDYSGIM